MDKKFDFIIIGGGSSGIVAAAEIISKLNATKNNAEFFDSMNKPA